MPRQFVKGLIALCHASDVLVSTGGFIERVLTLGPEAVDNYIDECRNLGFDIIEISSGFISIPNDDWLRLVEKVQKAGPKAKPQVGIQFGAGAQLRLRSWRPTKPVIRSGRSSRPSVLSMLART